MQRNIVVGLLLAATVLAGAFLAAFHRFSHEPGTTTPVADGSDPWRPLYHFSPPQNWMNDPNGLIQWHGLYHLFYQHNPSSPVWGNMSWGHATSRDLLHWTVLPIALRPTPGTADEGGVFSGSAVDQDGNLTLVYSSASQQILSASSRNGIDFEKAPGGPLLSGPGPEGDPKNFRDPKVWRHQGEWYMVVGSSLNGKGRTLLYTSADLRNWAFKGVALEADAGQGSVWECPDLFQLGDSFVLLVSAQDQGATLAFVGNFSYETGRFIPHHVQRMDFGPDFYAAQTFLDDEGRRILIAWMDEWNAPVRPTRADGWVGAMTVPRVLSLTQGAIRMEPVAEVGTLPGETVRLGNLRIAAGTTRWVGNSTSRAMDLTATFDLRNTTAEGFGLRLRASSNGTEETLVIYDRTSGMVAVDRDHAGHGLQGIAKARLLPTADGKVRFRVLLDSSSVEVFGDDGVVVTSRIFPSLGSSGLGVFAFGGSASLDSLSVKSILEERTRLYI